ncbi:MAG: PDZ domain-containing protein [Alphaproteobacteria bacterium]|nr:PDZ domain-containing protein [Alphaproteobacteria bacterium]
MRSSMGLSVRSALRDCVVLLLLVSPAWAAGIPMDEARGVFTLAPVPESTAPAIVSVVATGANRAQARTVGLQARRPAEGSGVIVDAVKGFILTSNHVVAGASSIVVMLHDGRALDAKFIGGDAGTDIAVLKVSPVDLVAVPMGDAAALKVGDFVLALGNPYGLGQSVSSGIISGLGRGGINADRNEDFIQTDAAINPGNSGGALIDTRGRLVGINAAIYGPSNGGNALGIGFAVPIDIARSVMDQIVAYGDIKRGRLGASMADIAPAQYARLGRSGAIVNRIDKGSPAERSGLAINDVVLGFNGMSVRNARDLNNKVALTRAGASVRLSILRDGNPLTVDVAVGEAQPL